MAKRTPAKKYTRPELRDKIKEELMQSDKGGKTGQWSARKSQLLVQEYERQGGGYAGKKDEAAHSLEEWTKQEWQTQQGGANARGRKTTKRYFPKQAWEMLTEEEKREAEQTKQKGSGQGEQFVEYTPAMKKALKRVQEAGRQPDGDGETRQALYQSAQQLGIAGRSRMTKEELRKAVEKAKQ
ncbi:MAG: hypothetical protein H7Z75_00200 [Ferruginibacter sp.]|nr:hypothetical protein [Cytophagales bacterium]